MFHLTYAEIERLAKLVEELGESVQAVGKTLLHGYHVLLPDGTYYDNEGDLSRELGDVKAATRLMHDNGDLSEDVIDNQQLYKRPRITRFMKHQPENQPEHVLRVTFGDE